MGNEPGRPKPGSHAHRPARGELLPALSRDEWGIHEVWCHPDDTDELVHGGGLTVVNGRPATAVVVDRHAYADQLRITLGERADSW